MKFIISLLSLIPVKKMAKYLPEIIGFILTKVMKWLAVKNPKKLNTVILYLNKVSSALELTLEAGEDGIYTAKEIKAIAESWKKEL